MPDAQQPPPAEPYRWLSEPRWFLWEGGFLLLARATGLVPLHEHHAIQIVISFEGEVAICGKSEDWQFTRDLIVRPDAPHAFNCNCAFGAMLFVDPESTEGMWLRNSLKSDITLIANPRIDTCADSLRPLLQDPLQRPEKSNQVGDLIRHCVHALSPGAPPARRIDPRVTTVLNSLRQIDDLHLSLERASEKAFLSPSRFAHLFKQQLGLPFSRYVLWRKLTRAMHAIASERTISDAAHAADFADAAHLTRTFARMVGMTPSALMRGEFTQIPSPFDLPGPNSAAETFPCASNPSR